MHTALTIAGSDSGGGAGIQADLKTFAACGVYGMSAITAVTAQNTQGVTRWLAMPPDLVAAQIHAVVTDIGAGAVKIGMLANADIVRIVRTAIRDLQLERIVLDPVMIAKGGARLIEQDAVDALRDDLLPWASVVTPNIPEAEMLTGLAIGSTGDMHDAGRRLLALGARAALVKGGHAQGAESIDVLCLPGSTREIRGPRLPGRHTHGTGCTLSSAVAAYLAKGMTLEESVDEARRYLEGAIRHAPDIGRGHGPLDHFWRLY